MINEASPGRCADRHADAFLRYAEHVGGSAESCLAESSPLDEQPSSLPYLGEALAHTVLEGFAADEFLLLKRYFQGDRLADIHHYVRRDETRHVAVGVSYPARALRDDRVREEYRAQRGVVGRLPAVRRRGRPRRHDRRPHRSGPRRARPLVPRATTTGCPR